jgi:hypothetical protein
MCFIFTFYFILLLPDPVFLIIGIREKGDSQEKRVLGSMGEMAEDGKLRVEKFNDRNYQLWKM